MQNNIIKIPSYIKTNYINIKLEVKKLLKC